MWPAFQESSVSVLRGGRKSASPDWVYMVNYPEDNTREMEEKGVSSAVKVE